MTIIYSNPISSHLVLITPTAQMYTITADGPAQMYTITADGPEPLTASFNISGYAGEEPTQYTLMINSVYDELGIKCSISSSQTFDLTEQDLQRNLGLASVIRNLSISVVPAVVVEGDSIYGNFETELPQMKAFAFYGYHQFFTALDPSPHERVFLTMMTAIHFLTEKGLKLSGLTKAFEDAVTALALGASLSDIFDVVAKAIDVKVAGLIAFVDLLCRSEEPDAVKFMEFDEFEEILNTNFETPPFSVIKIKVPDLVGFLHHERATKGLNFSYDLSGNAFIDFSDFVTHLSEGYDDLLLNDLATKETKDESNHE